jgi:uncharacterized DUF497 family protein
VIGGSILSLADAFELERALIEVDSRRAHKETRYQALSYIVHRLHMMAFTMRGKTGARNPAGRHLYRPGPPPRTAPQTEKPS